MSIILFAIIGATINAGAAFWACWAIYSTLKGVQAIIKFFEAVSDSNSDGI